VNPGIQRLLSLIAILAVAGITVSSISLQHHYAKSKTEYCDIGAAFNCDIVNRSEYSSILGIPVALIGMLGYGAVLGLATADSTIVGRWRTSSPYIRFSLRKTVRDYAYTYRICSSGLAEQPL